MLSCYRAVVCLNLSRVQANQRTRERKSEPERESQKERERGGNSILPTPLPSPIKTPQEKEDRMYHHSYPRSQDAPRQHARYPNHNRNHSQVYQRKLSISTPQPTILQPTSSPAAPQRTIRKPTHHPQTHDSASQRRKPGTKSTTWRRSSVRGRGVQHPSSFECECE